MQHKQPMDRVSEISTLMFEGKGEEALKKVRGLTDVHQRSSHGHTLIGLACSWGCEPVYRYLIEESRVNVESANIVGATPLMEACRHGQLEAARYLLANRAQVNCVNPQGDAAIVFAVESGNLDVVRLLIENGADPEFIQPSTGFSLLKIANLEARPQIEEYLKGLSRKHD